MAGDAGAAGDEAKSAASVAAPAAVTRPDGGGATSPALSLVAAGFGGLVAGAVALAIVAGGDMRGGRPGEAGLNQLAAADLADAGGTLTPGVGAAALQEAKACRIPLANVVLVKAPGDAGVGMVRIRSGSYVSPPFRLTDAPQRIAIPFPAPYETGRGTLIVEGAAAGASISLVPGLSVPSGAASFPINVWWRVGKPC
jgi:hypothetical protein